MAVCGERYKHLAVTISGYNLDNPYGLFVMPYTDYLEWRAVADKVIALVNVHMAALQATETTKNPTFPQFTKLSGERTLLLRHYEDLPSIIGTESSYEMIDMAISVVSEGLCLLEQIDMAIETYGDKAPEVPGLAPKPKEKPQLPELPKLPPLAEIPWWAWLIGGTATAAVVAGLYYRTRGPTQGPRR